jgi:hypothetical protein
LNVFAPKCQSLCQNNIDCHKCDKKTEQEVKWGDFKNQGPM